jgi:hypothetical protein
VAAWRSGGALREVAMTKRSAHPGGKPSPGCLGREGESALLAVQIREFHLEREVRLRQGQAGDLGQEVSLILAGITPTEACEPDARRRGGNWPRL